MSRFDETETAVVARLRALRVMPDVTINYSDLAEPTHAAGFSQKEITVVLNALEQDGILSFVPGNRILVLRGLPE
ncbi:hypothetical protein [Rhizobium sp. HT1-10]|uniref:hypothetical protein n=1 Tax=Rhizobium sp. HT1-10 TaxID=3111638 RepID=UPI003C19B550